MLVGLLLLLFVVRASQRLWRKLRSVISGSVQRRYGRG